MIGIRIHHKNRPQRRTFGATRVLFSASIGLLSAFQNVAAIEPEDVLHYQVGNISLRPSFGISQTYNDNIFSIGDDADFLVPRADGTIDRIQKEGDLITSFQTGGTVMLGRPSANNLFANYTYSQLYYLDHSNQNAAAHNLNFGGGIKSGRVELTPQLLVSSQEAVLAGSGRSDIAIDQLVERTLITASLNGTVKLTPKVFASSRALYSLQDFEEGIPLFDNESIEFTQGIGLQLRPKIGISVTGTIGERDTEANVAGLFDDNTQDFVGGGLRIEGQFGSRITGEVNVGFQRTTFNATSDSFLAPVAGVSLDYLLGRDMLAQISYIRQTFVGIQVENSSGVSDNASVSLRKTFGTRQKWSAAASGSIYIQNWDSFSGISGNRKDESYGATLSINYRIQPWLTSSLSQSYRTFSSSLSSSGQFTLQDFTVNTTTLSVRVGY